ncbi:YdcF family protein [Roseicyclus marinus]|uniref:YdcF family protein n=1 Tax=Roseicyclus marinus TaxID=2161673 RepID=UPI0024102F3F|nr:YdcF family protein [Roseicyclus marinus]MDG3042438.1 YdcF family protein [Roseicyclus marinus]
MIYLHKLLPALASPIMALMLLTLLSLLTRSRAVKLLTFFLFLMTTNPILANRAIAYLERDFPPKPLATIEPLDHVVVLSGMIRAVVTEDGTLIYEFGEAVDRFAAGLNLLASGQADTLILTRGQLPWSTGRPEGEVLRDIALAHGIDPENILLTTPAQNTAEEAQAIAEMLHNGARIGLVTSAFHMPRALQVFRSQGLDPRPIAVDYRQDYDAMTFMDVIPSAAALDDISLFTREMIGRAYYAIR